MKIIHTLCLVVGCLFLSSAAYGQDHHDHHHSRNEIGINSGALYALNDKEWGAGVHIHYFRALGDHSRWSIGGFAEQTLFFDSHFSFGVGVKYELFKDLYISAMPGLAFSKHSHDIEHEHVHGADEHHKENTKTKFSVHTELVYKLFEWGKFHMGPAIDYSWSKKDSHIMLGVHAAIDF